MQRSLASRGIEKTYQVKQYKEFPFKKDNDPVVKEYNKPKEAAQGVKYFSRRALTDERFYVMDRPHEEIKATEKQERGLKNALESCGLR